MASSKSKRINFDHIVLTANERKYILCLYSMVKDDQFTLTATDGDCLYKTSIKSEKWKKMWNDFASASIEITDNAFVAKLKEDVECVLEAVKGDEKAGEMFSLIVTLAESNQSKRMDGETGQQTAVTTLPNFFPSIKSRAKTVKLKGSSLVSPTRKKRKAASGVIYE